YPEFNTLASPQARATICRPIGNPSLVNPHGTEMAGKPARLNGAVKRVNRAACSTASSPSTWGAAIGVVGVSNKSYDSKNNSHRLRTSVWVRLARIYSV